MYFLTCRSTEQNKPVPQCSILLFDPLWKTTQVKEVNKRKETTTQISIETHQGSPGKHAACKRREKKNRQQRRKLRYSKLPAHPPSTSSCFPLNHLLISPLMWSSCELALAGFRNDSKRQGSGQYNGVQCLFGSPKGFTLYMFVFRIFLFNIINHACVMEYSYPCCSWQG